MTWETSDRRDRLPPDWPKIVARVKIRAGNRCEKLLPSGARCPRVGTEVDHRRNNDDHRMSNLQLLCKHHHGKKSSREGLVARLRRKATPPAPPHPGRRNRT